MEKLRKSRYTQPKIYRQSYQEFVSICKKDPGLLKEIEIIGLLGSAEVEEAVSSWSDLDIFLVLKSDKFGNINLLILDKLKKIAFKLSAKYPIKISLLTHTMDNLVNYVGFEYLTHYSWANVSHAKEYNFKEKIEEILKERDVSVETKKRYCLFYLRDIRFNIVRLYVSLNQYNTKHYIKEFGKLIIDKMFTVTDLSLIFFNIWAKSKKEMIKLAKRKFQTQLDVKPLEKAYHLRLKWDKIEKKEIKEFLSEGIDYIIQLTTFIIRSYSYPTTIEFLRP